MSKSYYIIIGILVVVFVLLIIGFQAYAQEVVVTPDNPTAISPASDIALDLTKIVNLVFDVVAVIAVSLASWAALWLKKKWGVEVDLQKGEVLNTAILRGVDFAKVRLLGVAGVISDKVTVDIQNELIRTASQYIVDKVPETLAYFHIGPDRLDEMIRSRLIDQGSLMGISAPRPIL